MLQYYNLYRKGFTKYEKCFTLILSRKTPGELRSWLAAASLERKYSLPTIPLTVCRT